MKKLIILFCLGLFAQFSMAQIAISDVPGYSPNPKAVLDINSTTKGLLLPRLTTAQRITIAPTAAQAGLTVFDITTSSQWYYNGTDWKELAGGTGFTLPYSGTSNDGNNSLDITNTVGRAAYFQSPTSAETMRVYNSGTGNAAVFEGTNALETIGNTKIGGNMDITGTFKPNGVDGTAGQVLQNNGNGTMIWGNICDFKNFQVFDFNGAIQTFIVPAGITKIRAQAWGGGGNSNLIVIEPYNTCSGSGGGYAEGEFSVSAGESISIIVSDFNNGTPPAPFSEVLLSGSYIRATAGRMGLSSTSELELPRGGEGLVNGNVNNFIRRTGQSGKPADITYFQAGPTLFYYKNQIANGGDGANTTNTGAQGGSLIREVGNNNTKIYSFSAGALVPGGGRTSGSPTNSGGEGRVIINW